MGSATTKSFSPPRVQSYFSGVVWKVCLDWKLGFTLCSIFGFVIEASSARLEAFSNMLEVEVWNISFDRPSDPFFHLTWNVCVVFHGLSQATPTSRNRSSTNFCPMVRITFYKALPRDQPALHSLGWPSLKPKGYGFLQATHRCKCEIMADDVNHHFVAATRSITHTACHTSWRWGCTPLPRSPCTLRPESTGFFSSEGVREYARWRKGLRHSVFFVGLVFICPNQLAL